MNKKEIIEKIIALHSELKIIDNFLDYVYLMDYLFDMYDVEQHKKSLEKSIEYWKEELIKEGE